MADVVDSILHGCLYDDDYVREVLPFIKSEYFEDMSHTAIFKSFTDYMNKYNQRPAANALAVMIRQRDDITDDIYKDSLELLKAYHTDRNEPINRDWLKDQTEEWCKDRDLVLAVQKAIMIIRGEDKEMSRDALPDLLRNSLAVSFDTSVGHDFLNDYESRYDFYNEDLERLSFDLDMFNKITKGGVPNKTLNIILAGTGGFKSGTMCHMAAANLFAGKNVLYITMELAEERVAERIDANMLDIEIDDVKKLQKQDYVNKIESILANTVGNLIIKEYPTASAHTGHFRHLLRELELKKNFKPDVIYIDYLNICASARCRGGENSYTLVKSISEEIRGLAVEFDVPIWSATQTNRSGLNNTDVTLENVSESTGLSSTCDLMIAAMQSDDLKEQGLMLFKQLKNRFGDIAQDEKFVVGVNKAKMRLFDVDDQGAAKAMGASKIDSQAQKDVLNDAMSLPQFGAKSSKKSTSDSFDGFNFD